MHLASIHIYPLKAARAVDLEESFVEPCGLADDRRWLLVDEEGRFISQREEPSLARVVVSCGPGCIRVSADGRTGLVIAEPPAGAALIKVRVWSDALLAAAAGPEADAWFSAFLGRPVGLVHLDDPTRRPVDPQYGRDGDVVSFADGFPLLLTSTGSLGELGDWLAADRQAPVPMTRFRPSVVVSRSPALGRRPLAPHPHRRGTVPRGQALRAVRRHHHRPDHRRTRQAAAQDARPASALRKASLSSART